MYIKYDLSKVLSTWNEYKYVCAIQFFTSKEKCNWFGPLIYTINERHSHAIAFKSALLENTHKN